jgi:putative endonuclease
MATDYYLYILLCENGCYYTGITTNVEQRFQQHQAGTAAKYTRSFKPVKIAAQWKVGASRSKAQQLEYQVKQLSHEQKTALTNNPDSIKVL